MTVSPALLSLMGFILLQTAVVAFALGRLFQRVSAIEKGDDGNAGMSRAVTRLEVQMETANDKLDALARDMHAAQRQLANVAMGKTAFYEFPPAGEVNRG